MEAAVVALKNWNPDLEPEPRGWYRNPLTGWRIDLKTGWRYYQE